MIHAHVVLERNIKNVVGEIRRIVNLIPAYCRMLTGGLQHDSTLYEKIYMGRMKK